ncbi:hypothetical protein [Thalassovita sp.]|uniref:hypothetical protein n=1 Tax=Thalassovita sp. TaxID=1979401 RepID=UPI002B26F496|nr:hypothetical protein [Thalassovita sp.]
MVIEEIETGPDLIKRLIAQEMREYHRAHTKPAETRSSTHADLVALRTLEDFKAALIEPVETEVLFSGGQVLACWSVTRSNGAYRVIYLPQAALFSLAVESMFGPVDIGVHGPAIAVFSSVG